jgi:hypothetical protein
VPTSEILSWHLPGRTEENYEKLQLNSRCPSRDSNSIPFKHKLDALPLNPADWCLKIARTSWSKILLENVIFLQPVTVKKCPLLWKFHYCSQELAPKPYLEPDESNPHLPTLFLYLQCSCIIHVPTSNLQKGIIFTTKILCAYPTAPMHANLNLLDINTVIIYDWKLLSFSLRSFIQPLSFSRS